MWNNEPFPSHPASGDALSQWWPPLFVSGGHSGDRTVRACVVLTLAGWVEGGGSGP